MISPWCACPERWRGLRLLQDVPAAAPAGSPADVDSAAAKDEASPMEADAPAANGAEDGSA